MMEEPPDMKSLLDNATFRFSLGWKITLQMMTGVWYLLRETCVPVFSLLCTESVAAALPDWI